MAIQDYRRSREILKLPGLTAFLTGVGLMAMGALVIALCDQYSASAFEPIWSGQRLGIPGAAVGIGFLVGAVLFLWGVLRLFLGDES